MADIAVPNSQIPKKAARRRYVSRLSRYAIIGAAFGVLLGWLCAIGLRLYIVGRYGPRFDYPYLSLPGISVAAPVVSMFGGSGGFVGLFCGFLVGLGDQLRRWPRRARRRQF